MEEKNVKFNIVTGVQDENGNPNICISSDIDENIDYLDLNERTCLILELIAQCGKQIIDINFSDNGIEEYDENDSNQIEVRDNLHKFTEELIYLILNTIYSLERVKFGKNPQPIEFSMATYVSKLDLFGNKIHRTKDTYHSPEVNAIDPIQASFDFFIDTICCLLNDNVSKTEVKELIDGYMTSMKKDYMNIIDDY